MASSIATSAALPRSGTAESDHAQAWRQFLESYSPSILRLIRRADVCRRDEVMDVYLRVCERLERDEGARLSAFDPGRGTIVAWLAVVVRRVTVDWVRSRVGRRRHFASITRLGMLERCAFELKYWQDPPPGDYAASLTALVGRPVLANEADAALERVERALDQRHRIDLCAALTRAQPAVSIDRCGDEGSLPVADHRPDPEKRMLTAEIAGEMGRLLARLPDEDRQILQLKYAHGCSHREMSATLGVEVSDDRVRRAVARLRALIGRRGFSYAEVSVPGVRFLMTVPFRPRSGSDALAHMGDLR
jgi:RNA polymerase sigma factor (sigma-70 family)